MASISRKVTAGYLIAQGSTSVYYPNSTTPAFTDSSFYKKCGKTSASGTISGNGCAIVALGMFILYKGRLTNNSANTYDAVAEATRKGTNVAADFTAQGFTATVGSSNVSVGITSIPDLSLAIQAGSVCMARLQSGGKSHYVIVDGWNEIATDFDRYLVADPAGGKHITLKKAMENGGYPVNASSITQRYKFS